MAHFNYIHDIRDSIPYEIDGTAIKVTRSDYQVALGTIEDLPVGP